MIMISKNVIGIYEGGGGRIDAGGGLFAGGLFAAGLIAGGLFASGLNAAPRSRWSRWSMSVSLWQEERFSSSSGLLHDEDAAGVMSL